MEAKPKIIKIYSNQEREPFNEWLNSLKDRVARAKIRTRIDRVSLGNYGDFKSVGEGVFELRIDWGPGYRVYFTEDAKQIVLLLCGGEKSTQADDIELAKYYWKDYQRG